MVHVPQRSERRAVHASQQIGNERSARKRVVRLQDNRDAEPFRAAERVFEPHPRCRQARRPEPPKTRTVGTPHCPASSSAASSSLANGRASSIDVSSDTSGTCVRARILRVAPSTADGSIGSPSSKRSSRPS